MVLSLWDRRAEAPLRGQVTCSRLISWSMGKWVTLKMRFSLLPYNVKHVSVFWMRLTCSTGASQAAQWWLTHLPTQGTQETQVPSLGQEDPLGEELATPSSILVREIPGTEEPGGLQSMRLQKVRYGWATECKCNTWSFNSPSGVRRRAKIRSGWGRNWNLVGPWKVSRIYMGGEERGCFSNGAGRESRDGKAPCVFGRPSRGLSACDEGSAYNMQKQRDASRCQAAKEASSVESLPLAAMAQPWGDEWGPSCCCQGHSPGWLTALPPSPGSFWGSWPLGARAATDPARVCIVSFYFWVLQPLDGRLGCLECKPELLRLVGVKAPQLGQSWGRGPSKADQQKPRDATAVPFFWPVFHLVGSGPHPSMATPCFATAGVVTRNPKEHRAIILKGQQTEPSVCKFPICPSVPDSSRKPRPAWFLCLVQRCLWLLKNSSFVFQSKRHSKLSFLVLVSNICDSFKLELKDDCGEF